MTDTPGFAASLIRSSARALASAVASRMEQEAPELLARLPKTFATPRDDLQVRLDHLAAAIEFDRPALIEQVVQWYAVALHYRGVAADYLVRSLEVTEQVLSDELPPASRMVVRRQIAAAKEAAKKAEFDLPSHIDTGAPHGRTAGHFLLAMLEGRGDDAVDLIKQAMNDGMSVAELHDHVLVPVQRESGRMWLTAEIQVADEHFSSQIVDRVLWFAQERLPRPPADAPLVLAMGVTGDLHGFGLRMIAQRLQADGLRVHNLGPDMPAGDLEGALHGEFDLVTIGATMVLHLSALVGLVAEVRRLLGATPIIVGGPPFASVDDLHELVGADAAANDGGGASAAARRLLQRG